MTRWYLMMVMIMNFYFSFSKVLVILSVPKVCDSFTRFLLLLNTIWVVISGNANFTARNIYWGKGALPSKLAENFACKITYKCIYHYNDRLLQTYFADSWLLLWHATNNPNLRKWYCVLMDCDSKLLTWKLRTCCRLCKVQLNGWLMQCWLILYVPEGEDQRSSIVIIFVVQNICSLNHIFF